MYLKYSPVKSFNILIEKRQMEKILNKHISNSNNVLLLCSEDIPKQCHRRLVADHYKKYNNSINIVHLTKRDSAIFKEYKFYKKKIEKF